MLSESYLKHDEVCLGDDACAGFQFSPLLARQGTQDPSQGNYTINLTLRQFDTPWENGTLYEDYTHYFEEGLCQFIGYDSIDNGLPICQNETGLPAVNYDAFPDEFSSQRVTAFVQKIPAPLCTITIESLLAFDGEYVLPAGAGTGLQWDKVDNSAALAYGSAPCDAWTVFP